VNTAGQALELMELIGEPNAEVSNAMRSATCIWRDLAPSSDVVVREGLAYLQGLEGSGPS
jgi:hypothetical protein